jgi:hypothetical protein
MPAPRPGDFAMYFCHSSALPYKNTDFLTSVRFSSNMYGVRKSVHLNLSKKMELIKLDDNRTIEKHEKIVKWCFVLFVMLAITGVTKSMQMTDLTSSLG